MRTPKGMSEAQALAIIEKVVASVVDVYKFGYHDREDIKQEARIIAIELLASGKYDEERPLENFLYTSICNGLSNIKRKQLRRNDPPCLACHTAKRNKQSDYECPKATNDRFCEKYLSWYKINNSKENVMNMLDMSAMERPDSILAVETFFQEDVDNQEVLNIIDSKLSVDDRKLLLKIRDNVNVPKVKRLALIEKIRNIVGEYGLEIPPE